MNSLNRRLGWVCGLTVVASLVAGCSSVSLNRAPVEDHGKNSSGTPQNPSSGTTPATGTDLPPVMLPQGHENAGKPGYYTIKPGDTLIRIALETGQSFKDIARWSQVENADRIEVGQVLRVIPPVAKAPVLAGSAAAGVVAPVASAPSAVASAPAGAASKPAMADSDIQLVWPVNGAVLTGFDEVKNKGLDISGTAGDPVLAAADGRVVYVGAGLRGYGNLVILKHDNVFLTAYAHNQTLLVKEDQAVRRGQKIAEMGSSDADRVKLHFEVRKQGKPVDPIKYLPER